MNVNKPMLFVLKLVGILVVSAVALALILWLGLNLFKFVFYSEYFSLMSKETQTPGLKDNYIPQGITYYDNLFIIAGYMSDNSDSRIYTVDCKTNEIRYFPLVSNGKSFTGHTGGIQYLNGYIYLANEGNSLYKFTAASIFQKSGTKIEMGAPINLNTNTSFVYGKDNYLYVGEFYYDGYYPCSNEISFAGKTHYAIVEKYDTSDLTKPLAVYSIPEKIQGFCIKEDGTIILSESWSVTSSFFHVYESDKIQKTGETYNDAEVYFLTEPTRRVKAPAMSEDLDIIKTTDNIEKVVTMFESACNKYLFGKLFFANYIASLDF